ncbi:hypothetical protein SDC9_165668 [bioreactor metagenome]|uniref:TonB-dependent receptor plug domain-containing protein n=1 Tax=bioreactor metagenome TaxID=1076179 RepID=A0A645FUW3_9ZZZZ
MFSNLFTFFLVLLFTIKSFAQNIDTIKLSAFKLCELTTDFLKQKDPNLKEVKVEEMNLCKDGFVQDARYENRIGYESSFFPGVIFQKYRSDVKTIAKIHLTKNFKGYLPDGNYIDMKNLKAIDILKKYDSLQTWTSRGCSDYWGINYSKKIFFYVKINKDKKPQYPIDENYYSEQSIEGIDIMADCYSYYEEKSQKIKPLIILEGKEVSEESMYSLKPEDVEKINVLKDKSATDKYGDKGKNGVIEVFLKKKN